MVKESKRKPTDKVYEKISDINTENSNDIPRNIMKLKKRKKYSIKKIPTEDTFDEELQTNGDIIVIENQLLGNADDVIEELQTNDNNIIGNLSLDTVDNIIDERQTNNENIIGDLLLNMPLTIQKKKSCSLVSCFLLTICISCVLLGCVIIVSYAILGTPNPLKFFQSFRGSPNIKAQWDTVNNAKLELVVQNALDDSWTPYLEEYVKKWDNGEPDSLSLTISRVSVDKTCKPAYGRLKICNGNYGKTSWEGLNLSLVQDGFIRWSTSRMNDYFLGSGSEASKKYTMCHELGHGFGLAHSDEDYYNLNRGDCMDYTRQPEGNLSTGRSNHEVLKKVYGSNSLKKPPPQNTGKVGIPQHIIDKYFEVEEEVQYSEGEDFGDWIEDIGEGYQIVINKLEVARE